MPQDTQQHKEAIREAFQEMQEHFARVCMEYNLATASAIGILEMVKHFAIQEATKAVENGAR